MELAYIGNKGNHLYRFRSYNTAFHTETGENLDPRQGQLQELRTFPSIGPISAIESSASSIYHSLHFRTSRRFRNGVSFINSFTWAKSIDDASDPLQSFYQNLGAQDERNLGLERGLSFHDIRKRFTSSVIWELPFGTGQRWLNKGLLGYIAGPWQLTSNLIAQDGYAQTLIGFSTSSTTGTFQRPNIVPGEPLVLPKSQRRNPLRWYNPAAVQWPGPFELGNAGRNIAPTPGAVTANVGVFRRIRLPGEGQAGIGEAAHRSGCQGVHCGGRTHSEQPGRRLHTP